MKIVIEASWNHGTRHLDTWRRGADLGSNSQCDLGKVSSPSGLNFLICTTLGGLDWVISESPSNTEALCSVIKQIIFIINPGEYLLPSLLPLPT